MATWGGSWLCCMRLYTTTLFAVSVRSQGDEVQVSDRCSRIPASPTDASGDADPEPAATVKSLIESFDTVGQSECWAPQQHTHTASARTAAQLQGTAAPCINICRFSAVLSWPDCEDSPAVVVCGYWHTIQYVGGKYLKSKRHHEYLHSSLLLRLQRFMFCIFLTRFYGCVSLCVGDFYNLTQSCERSCLFPSNCSFRWTRPLRSRAFHCTEPTEQHPRPRHPCCCRLPNAGMRPHSPLKTIICVSDSEMMACRFSSCRDPTSRHQQKHWTKGSIVQNSHISMVRHSEMW